MARNIVIIGSVALGSKAACRAKRLDPEATVYLVDKDDYISYGACGIPYYISGDVNDESELRSTSFHMLRDERFFLKDKGIIALTGTEATKIDRQQKTVHIRKKDKSTDVLSYDKLVIATGASPRRLDLPGEKLENVFTVSNLRDAIAIKQAVTNNSPEKAVIIGAGFIGLEMTEALSDMWEIETTVVELLGQVMPGFIGSYLADMVKNRLKEHGVTVHTSEKVLEIMGTDKVTGVRTDKRELPADLVIISAGVVPNTDLAREAGLELTPQGLIVVNDQMQTSNPDIYSGGDCVAIPHLITGQLAHFPLGAMANRQGRVIGTNITGGQATFDGAVGSFVVKIFDGSLAGAGLTLEKAKAAGFDAEGVLISQFDRAHFYVEKEIIFLELVVDRKTRRVLGIQGLGGPGSEMVGRINAVAATLKYKPLVEDIGNLEIAYSPPFASAMDIVNALGNAAANYLDGRYRPMKLNEFRDAWENRDNGEIFFLDCRAMEAAQPFEKKFPEIWKSVPHDQLADRMAEVPRDKKIVLVCNTGLRSYETQLNLDTAGITNNVSIAAGMAGLKESGVDFHLDE